MVKLVKHLFDKHPTPIVVEHAQIEAVFAFSAVQRADAAVFYVGIA